MIERCDHCTAAQAAAQAWLAEQGCKSWIDWDSTAVGKPDPPAFHYRGGVPIETCPCECHSWARIVGRLPRL